MKDIKLIELENSINTYFNTVEAIRKLNELVYETHNSIVEERDSGNVDFEKVDNYRIYTLQLTSLQMNIGKIIAEIKILKKLLSLEGVALDLDVPENVIDDIIHSDNSVYSVDSKGEIILLENDLEQVIRDAKVPEEQLKTMISNMQKLDETYLKTFKNEQKEDN